MQKTKKKLQQIAFIAVFVGHCRIHEGYKDSNRLGHAKYSKSGIQHLPLLVFWHLGLDWSVDH